ncbi:MAG: hypothetical protein GY696_16715 [Gammaproteobacteria bacterium]|nr:hypothetical protein [Gammaproteobacteria bacterium]
MSCAGHMTAIENAHKLLACWFQTRNQQVWRIMGLVDMGNTVPGSAAISVDLARELGITISPSRLKVTTAAQGSPLEVVGTVASLVMGISPTNLLKLTDVVVYRNLGHQLNLGLNFCCQFKARLDYEVDQPFIEIQGEKYSLVNSVAPEKRGGEREQPRDLEQAQRGQRHLGSNHNQMSTFDRQFEKLGVKLAPAVSITNMSGSIQGGGVMWSQGKGNTCGSCTARENIRTRES